MQAETVRAALELPQPMPVETLLTGAASRWPDKVGIDFYHTIFTFKELYDLAIRVAKGLQIEGVRPGDRVGLHLPNTPQYIAGLFGILMAGGIVVNLSPLVASKELDQQVRDAGARVILTLDEPGILSRLALLIEKDALDCLVVCRLDDFGPAPPVSGFAPRQAGSHTLPQEIRFTDLIANDGIYQPARHGNLGDEIAVLQYTGGTTGEPKAAMLTHANFSAAMSSYRRNGWEFDLPGGSSRRILVVSPIFHIVSLTCSVLQSVATGASLVLHLKFDAERVLDDISRKRINVFSGVPTMYTMLVRNHRAAELASLRYCFSSGAPFPADVLERFQAITGITPRSGYGLTETTTAGASYPESYTVKPGSVGIASPYSILEIRDVESGSRILPAGEAGEVCIAGPQVMKGYWKRSEATAEAVRGGRFHTGDIGYLDSDGFLVLIDRKKDMILSGGFNVFPRIVEDAVRKHPAISDVAVVGVDHKILGQGVKAFVVIRPGEKPPGLHDLRAFLADKLASYERPVEMEVLESLPKTDIGKPSKAALIASTKGKPPSHQS